MRLTRIALLSLGVAALVGCDDDATTSPNRPPVGGVRFINAVADTNAVDIRFIDQVEWSAVANNLNFRAGTEHQPTQAGQRRIRVWSYRPATTAAGDSANMHNVTQRLVDTTVTITANANVTLLLTGSARAGTVRFVEIQDIPLTLSAGQIGVRSVNATTGETVDVYYTATATSTISGPPSVDNLAPLAGSSYQVRSTGTFAARVTPDNSTTASASAAGPLAPAGATGASPAAGVNTAGSAFSVYYFPRGVAGSPQNALTTPAVIWFVDRVPLPPTASTSP